MPRIRDDSNVGPGEAPTTVCPSTTTHKKGYKMPNIHTPEGVLARTREYYDTFAQAYAERTADLVADLLLDFATSLVPGSKVLDVGCGPGRDLARLTGLGFSAVGLDLSFAFCNMAQKHAPTVQADLSHIPLADQSFDGVWAYASLVHLGTADAKEAILELRRVLRMGGITEISVKTKETSGWIGEGDERRWFHGWDQDEFTSLVGSCGFRVTWSKENRGFFYVRATKA